MMEVSGTGSLGGVDLPSAPTAGLPYRPVRSSSVRTAKVQTMRTLGYAGRYHLTEPLVAKPAEH